MTITDRYLEALKEIDGWVTVGEWALKVADLYPELLENAERQAQEQKNDTTGLRELMRRISSNITRGAYEGKIEIDTSYQPRRVKYIEEEEAKKHAEEEFNNELESLSRAERIRQDYESLSPYQRYRLQEFDAIAKTFNHYFKTDLEIDHAQSLMGTPPGKHHPDNLQLISRTHNRIKSKKSWKRMSLEEQIRYLEKMISYHQTLFEVDPDIFSSLVNRIKIIY